MVDAGPLCGFGEAFHQGLMCCISDVGGKLGFRDRDCFLFGGFKGEFKWKGCPRGLMLRAL